MSRLDGRAVLLGAAVALVVAVPPAVIAQVRADRDTLEASSWVLVLFALILIAFVAGGWVAARQGPAQALANGAVAALVAFAVVQGYGVARRLADGDDVRWLAILFNALLTASCGTVGAVLASRRGRRSP